jgi:hypothetical protein
LLQVFNGRSNATDPHSRKYPSWSLRQNIGLPCCIFYFCLRPQSQTPNSKVISLLRPDRIVTNTMQSSVTAPIRRYMVSTDSRMFLTTFTCYIWSACSIRIMTHYQNSPFRTVKISLKQTVSYSRSFKKTHIEHYWHLPRAATLHGYWCPVRWFGNLMCLGSNSFYHRAQFNYSRLEWDSFWKRCFVLAVSQTCTPTHHHSLTFRRQ